MKVALAGMWVFCLSMWILGLVKDVRANAGTAGVIVWGIAGLIEMVCVINVIHKAIDADD